MVKKFLKIAGVKTEAEFYKKYPSEAAFFKAHPEAKDLKQYKQGGQQKKLEQLTSYQGDIDGIIPKAQNGDIGDFMRSVGNKNCVGATWQGILGDGASGGSGGQAVKVVPEWKDISNIENLGLDKKGRKALEAEFNTLKDKYPGLDLPTYVAATRDAGRTNIQFGQPDRYGKYFDPNTGDLLPNVDARSVDPFMRFYRKQFPGKTKIAPTDVLDIFSKMPGGISSYSKYADVGYVPPKEQDGGVVGEYMSSPTYDYKPIDFNKNYEGLNKSITGRSSADNEALTDTSGAALDAFGSIFGAMTPNVQKNGGNNVPKFQVAPYPVPPTQQQGPIYDPFGVTTMGGQQSQYNVYPPYNPDYQGPVDSGAVGAWDAAHQKKKPFDPTKYAGPAGQIIGGIKQIKEAKKQEKEANKQFQISGLVKQASQSRPEAIKRKYTRPEDVIINQNELFPTYGVGTNYLAKNGTEVTNQIGGNPTEIQNMYNPHDLYQDLGYEPLNDSEIVKQYQFGGALSGSSFGQIGNQLGAMVGGGGKGTPGGWSQVLGAIPGPIGMIGGMVGSVIDGRQQAKIRDFQEKAMKNIKDTAFAQGVQGIQSQFGSFLKDGGWVSHDWQPQVIATFGEHKVSDLLRPDPMMDTLRTGGHIRQNYTYPQDQFALGGELKTTWGGYAETMSQNPYLPASGETVMFRGKSHDESDGNGHTGIGVKYGDGSNDSYTDYAKFGSRDADADVEVERNEPALELPDENGQNNMVVYGNLKIPNQFLGEIGDPKAKGKKFKHYVKDLSKTEAKQNSIVEKNLKLIDDLDDLTTFDQMKFFSAKANIDGANMKLKDIAQKKINAAAVQNAINDTAKEYGIDADALAKNKIKIDKEAMNQAKWGAKMETAQTGKKKAKFDTPEWYAERTHSPAPEPETLSDGSLKFVNPDGSYYIVAPDKSRREYTKSGTLTATYDPPGKRGMIGTHKLTVTPSAPVDETMYKDSELTNKDVHYTITPRKRNPWIDAFNQLQPYIIPTNQETLDPAQLYGEMYGLSTNQLEPVPAQLYHPLLEQPYDISLQDQLNANQADFNAIQRMTGYNPSAQSALSAQKYAANSKVLAEQFRMNQAMRADVYNRNRQTLNQAQLQNLGILDQQMVRQETAKSRTKEVAQAALNSIADKIAKNKLENRTLGIYENLYNYRYTPSGRAINMNPLQQFDVTAASSSTDKLPTIEGYEWDTTPRLKEKKKGKEDTGRNGRLVKAFKNF